MVSPERNEEKCEYRGCGLTESAGSARKITAAERRANALELRKKGYSYAEIARDLGYASESGARKTVKIALEKLVKIQEMEAEEVRTLELARYDAIIKNFWPGVEASDDKAGRVVLAAIEARRELLGVDAPEKFVFELSPEAVRLLDKMGLSASAISMEFEGLVREAAKRAGINNG